jgi:orotate phosphoribosyltransferase
MNLQQKEQQVRALLERAGIFLTGHFVLTSGLHSAGYLNKQMLDGATASLLCNFIAGEFMDHSVDAVIAPAEGGRRLAKYVSEHLSILDECVIPGICAEKGVKQGAFFLKNEDIVHIKRKRILVVEDTVTTGGSVRKVVELARFYKSSVVGVGVICNRGKVTEENVGDVPVLMALVHIDIESWEKSKCPLCREGVVPIDRNIGSGRECFTRKELHKL